MNFDGLDMLGGVIPRVSSAAIKKCLLLKTKLVLGSLFLDFSDTKTSNSSCSPRQRAQEGRWRAQIQGNVGQTQGIRSY